MSISDDQWTLTSNAPIIYNIFKLMARCVESIRNQDEVEARNASDRLRQVRTFLKSDQKGRSSASNSDDLIKSLMRDVQINFEGIRILSPVIDAWRQGQLDRFNKSIDEGDGPDYGLYLDSQIPDPWDFETDIAIIVGEQADDLRKILEQRGQRRMVIVRSHESGERIETVTSTAPDRWQSLLQSLASFGAPIPARIFVFMSSEKFGEIIDLDALRQESRQWLVSEHTNRNTILHFGEAWVVQAVQNLPAVVLGNSVGKLREILKGKPAIIISPGPSLSKNIDLLHQAKGHAVLIAPLQALKILKTHGIKPDFVTVVDPQDMTGGHGRNFFEKIDTDDYGHILALISSHPNVIQQKPDDSILYCTGSLGDLWIAKALDEDVAHVSGGSVSVTSFRLALSWGCSPLILVGQDLTYSDGRHYAGVDDEKPKRATPFTAPGYYGGVVNMPYDFFVYHFYFESLARSIAEQKAGVELFNCTEGGAYIAGFVHSTLAEVLEGIQKDHSVSVNLKKLISEPKDNTARSRKIQLATKLMEQSVQTGAELFDVAMNLAESCSSSSSDLVSGHDPGKLSQVQTLLKKMISLASENEHIYTLCSKDLDLLDELLLRSSTPSERYALVQSIATPIAVKASNFRRICEDVLIELQQLEAKSNNGPPETTPG